MAWKQIRAFNINRMGRRKGWCLQNCRLGFGIPSGKYASALADKNAQAKAGTLHSINSLPKNVAVPVYTKGTSKYGHVIVSDRGVFYSDGVRSSLYAHGTIYGWGELCDGQRVVSWQNAPAPAPSGFFPSKGYWCRYDIDPRVGKLASFMRSKFPAYTPATALGNKYGDNLWRAIKEFQKRTGLQQDGNTGPITYAKLKAYGFKE